MKKIATTLLIAVAAVAICAQTPDMGPSAELKKLDWMLGEWTGKMNMDMMGSKFESVQNVKCEWDGKFMKTTSVMDVMGMKMTESMYMGYDPKTKKYTTHSFTNFSPYPRIETGELVGNKFVSISQLWEVDGMAPTTSRATLWLEGKALKMTLEFKEGDKWTVVGSGSMTKKGG